MILLALGDCECPTNGDIYGQIEPRTHTTFDACCPCRTVLFDDDVYLKGQGYEATMEARKSLETSEDFTKVRHLLAFVVLARRTRVAPEITLEQDNTRCSA